MKNLTLLLTFLVHSKLLSAQSAGRFINRGNEQYRLSNYAQALEWYKKALKEDPKNNTALYNYANTLYRQKKYQAAIDSYKSLSQTAINEPLKEAIAYNTGLSYLKLKNTDLAIVYFQQALRIMPDDTQARENLVKAMREQAKQRPSGQKNNDKKKPPVNKELMETKFMQLRNEEKAIQRHLQNKQSNNGPEKNW